MPARSLVRLLTVGAIVVAQAAGGPWYWLGYILAGLVVWGIATALRRPASGWTGAMALVLWLLLHEGWINPVVGAVLLTLCGGLFTLLWLHGPRTAHRRTVPARPPLGRQAG
ncbi:MAG: hypothetical protein K6V97_12370 [Actinomycetia bacterium]|nr:hypothetical protein [Actinomycetes bacterium]